MATDLKPSAEAMQVAQKAADDWYVYSPKDIPKIALALDAFAAARVAAAVAAEREACARIAEKTMVWAPDAIRARAKGAGT